jgi:hypothetical protein
MKPAPNRIPELFATWRHQMTTIEPADDAETDRCCDIGNRAVAEMWKIGPTTAVELAMTLIAQLGDGDYDIEDDTFVRLRELAGMPPRIEMEPHSRWPVEEAERVRGRRAV